jgi:arginyl-tRNA synthetase
MLQTAEETTRELGKANELSNEDAVKLFRTIGLGALKYFILKVDPKKNMMFDPKESIDFNGNTGPFIQYTYARIQSLLAKADAAGYLWEDTKIPCHLPLLPLEKDIIKRIYQFRDAVAQAGAELSPAIVANYVFDLAKGFNQFYQELPVIKEDDPEKAFLRICISKFTGSIIQKSMKLLGIEVPERM